MHVHAVLGQSVKDMNGKGVSKVMYSGSNLWDIVDFARFKDFEEPMSCTLSCQRTSVQ